MKSKKGTLDLPEEQALKSLENKRKAEEDLFLEIAETHGYSALTRFLSDDEHKKKVAEFDLLQERWVKLKENEIKEVFDEIEKYQANLAKINQQLINDSLQKIKQELDSLLEHIRMRIQFLQEEIEKIERVIAISNSIINSFDQQLINIYKEIINLAIPEEHKSAVLTRFEEILSESQNAHWMPEELNHKLKIAANDITTNKQQIERIYTAIDHAELNKIEKIEIIAHERESAINQQEALVERKQEMERRLAEYKRFEKILTQKISSIEGLSDRVKHIQSMDTSPIATQRTKQERDVVLNTREALAEHTQEMQKDSAGLKQFEQKVLEKDGSTESVLDKLSHTQSVDTYATSSKEETVEHTQSEAEAASPKEEASGKDELDISVSLVEDLKDILADCDDIFADLGSLDKKAQENTNSAIVEINNASKKEDPNVSNDAQDENVPAPHPRM